MSVKIGGIEGDAPLMYIYSFATCFAQISLFTYESHKLQSSIQDCIQCRTYLVV
jgi:hypothetical protein